MNRTDEYDNKHLTEIHDDLFLRHTIIGVGQDLKIYWHMTIVFDSEEYGQIWASKV